MPGKIAVTIEPMRVRDLDQILRVERLSFTTPWSRAAFLSELLENDRARYVVARVGDQVVGYTGMWLVVDEGHVTNVAVHPHWRNMGVATQLLTALMDIARQNGLRRMTLEVRKSNIVAHTLYEKLGFKDAGIRRGYYQDNNEDAIIMWKDLA
ncbi:MAG: ribosomal protein S18-alanine N-acetyltransferase [Limnochordaceae bacterium]|nr:ribosomal protein S18-alanine N-acetyltransferase [Limnochordaceae bacterium]